MRIYQPHYRPWPSVEQFREVNRLLTCAIPELGYIAFTTAIDNHGLCFVETTKRIKHNSGETFTRKFLYMLPRNVKLWQAVRIRSGRKLEELDHIARAQTTLLCGALDKVSLTPALVH